MPVVKIAKREIPWGRGAGESLLRTSDEWRDAMAVLTDGNLKPYEAAEITLGPDVKALERPKQKVHAFSMMLRAHIKKLGLAYDVIVRGDLVNDGTIYLVKR